MLSFASRMMRHSTRRWGQQTVVKSQQQQQRAFHVDMILPSYSHYNPTTSVSTTISDCDFNHNNNNNNNNNNNSLSTILGDYITSLSVWLIKRTFQPSLLRKKRKHGYLKRSESVGGRKILRRRKAKNRARLFGA